MASPATAIMETTTGRNVLKMFCIIVTLRYLIYNFASKVTIMQEGKIQPTVAHNAPKIPPICVPTKVAELMAIGPGVISAIVTRSVN